MTAVKQTCSRAAPILQEFGFGATFYITVGFLGKPGYLSEAQVRNLSSLGFEIGCHSLTHPYLTDLDDSFLHDETVRSKRPAGANHRRHC